MVGGRKIESSRKFSENFSEIVLYHATLKPGDVTLVGLITEGAQGMRTGNNARFLGYKEGTPQARTISEKREVWTRNWKSNPDIRRVFSDLLLQHGGDVLHPTANSAAWEACVEALKSQFDSRRQLGLSKTDLYRIVPETLIATESDFAFCWKQRKQTLINLWRCSQELQRK